MRRRRGLAAVAIVALACMLAIAGVAASASAATYTVGTTKDETGTCAKPAAGTCSLRQLIDHENALATTPSPTDTIVVPAGKYALASGDGELAIKQSLTIMGAGARSTSVEIPAGIPAARVFEIIAPSGGTAPTVTISGLEISGGTADETTGPGGDVVNTGSLVLEEDWITEGQASAGGGVANSGGTLSVEHSLVSDNHANTGGGEAGGIENVGTGTCTSACFQGKKAVLTVEDSTIADNDARLGAGIYSSSPTGDPNKVSIIDSTVADNTTKEESCAECTARGPGAGLLVSTGSAEVANSIFAFNDEVDPDALASNCAIAGEAGIASLGYNLASDSTCDLTATGDRQKTSPDFSSAEPQDNGGNTNTLAPEPTSAAVDAIPTSNTFCDGTDQRGTARPQGAGCDIGAVELVPFTIEATEGSPFSGKLTEAGCSISGTPIIDWGDGTSSDATVKEFAISGSHTYAEAGTYNGSVSYEDDCGTYKFPFQARIADAALSAKAVTVNATATVKFSGRVATFTDANPDGQVSDYTASITWGDGTSSAGTISAATGGGFEVTGSHTYAIGGVFKTTITIDDVGGSKATATGSANVIGAPVISEVSVGTVTATTAPLKFSIEPDGADTKYVIRYGHSTTYGQETKSVEIGATRGVQKLEQTLSGLEPNSLYHFEVLATNSQAAVPSADEVFTTLQKAPAVVTGSVSSITQTTATLNATVNPTGGEVTSCEFEYGKTESHGSSAACTPSPGAGRSVVAVSAAIKDLEANTTYRFQVSATNAGGTSDGSQVSFVTLPKAPTVLTGSASSITQASATLNGTVNPNGGEVTNCELEYGTTTTYGSSVACSPAAGSGTSAVAVSGAIKDLEANTTYHFRVLAGNAGGTSTGAEGSFKTSPKAPTVLTESATTVTQTEATLNGTVNPNGGEVTSCELEYGTTTTYGSSVACSPAAGSGTSAVAVSGAIKDLEANTTYHFRIVAVNAGGKQAGADQALTTPPSPVVSLIAPASSNQTGTAFSEVATVTENGVPLPDVPVTFTVTGVNPQAATVTTNEAGQATFAYTGEHPGIDQIVASFIDEAGTTEISSDVTKTWSEPVPGGGGAAGGSGGGPIGQSGVLAFKELSAPVLGETVNVVPVSGVVFVELPVGARLSLAGPLDAVFASLHKGTAFIPLTEARQIPVGSTLETTHGVVQLTTATASVSKTQFGDFGGGIFKLLQNRKMKGLTELNIINNHSPKQVCATLGKRAQTASKHLSNKVLGQLNSNDHGKFTTRGQYSAATVRGTVYSVTNQCAGTLTKVTRGIVSVRDFHRRKTITLFTGQHYLAKAPRSI